MIKRLKSHENSLKIEAALRICFQFLKVSYNKPPVVGLRQLSGIFQTTKQQASMPCRKRFTIY